MSLKHIHEILKTHTDRMREAEEKAEQISSEACEKIKEKLQDQNSSLECLAESRTNMSCPDTVAYRNFRAEAKLSADKTLSQPAYFKRKCNCKSDEAIPNNPYETETPPDKEEKESRKIFFSRLKKNAQQQKEDPTRCTREKKQYCSECLKELAGSVELENQDSQPPDKSDSANVHRVKLSLKDLKQPYELPLKLQNNGHLCLTLKHKRSSCEESPFFSNVYRLKFKDLQNNTMTWKSRSFGRIRISIKCVDPDGQESSCGSESFSTTSSLSENLEMKRNGCSLNSIINAEMVDVLKANLPTDVKSNQIKKQTADEKMPSMQNLKSHHEITRTEASTSFMNQLDDLFPDILDDSELQQIGTIASVLGQMVVIQAFCSPSLLQLSTVVSLPGKIILGRICDIFGSIEEPFYVVRVSNEHAIEKGISKGVAVYAASPQSEVATDQQHRSTQTDFAKKLPRETIEECLADLEEEIKQSKMKTFSNAVADKLKQLHPNGMTNNQGVENFGNRGFPFLDGNSSQEAPVLRLQATPTANPPFQPLQQVWTSQQQQQYSTFLPRSRLSINPPSPIGQQASWSHLNQPIQQTPLIPHSTLLTNQSPIHSLSHLPVTSNSAYMYSSPPYCYRYPLYLIPPQYPSTNQAVHFKPHSSTFCPQESSYVFQPKY